MGFLLNWREGKPEIYDSGDQLFSTTTLESVAQAVVGVLSHPEETKNRQVKIQDLQISQNKLIEIAKKVDPKRKWEPIAVSTKDVEKSTAESLAKGDFSHGVIFDQLKLSIFAEGYGQPLVDENELVGVTGKTDADVEAIWKRLLL